MTCFKNSSVAQTSIYHPFPDSAAYWRVFESDHSFPGDPELSLLEIYISGDTVCNNQTYHKLNVIGEWGYNYPWHTYDEHLYGVMWQDTPLKRVYFKYRNSISCYTCDSLLYDFNLVVGDSVSNNEYFMQTGSTLLIHSIDSININGNYRKKYIIANLLNQTSGVEIIEGIGSTLGGFYQYDVFEQYYRQECVNQDSSTLYSYPGYSSVALIANTDQNSPTKNSVTIFPSPVFDKFKIINISNVSNIQLIDLLGIKHDCLRYSITHNSAEVELTAKQTNGLYFVRFMANGMVYSKPILILNN